MSKVVRAVVGVALVVAGVITGNFQLIIAGVSLVGGALFSPKGGKPRGAAVTTLQVGEVSRQGIVGRAATAGSLVDAFNYGGKYGTDWEVLVIALADHRCDALEGFYVNDTYINFAGDGMIGGYNNQLSVWWRPGTETQTVPTVLTANGPGWTTNDNGAGVSYAVVAYKADASDAKNPVWTNGRPRFLFVVRGALCYDPRKDSTAGGVGAHRWLNPATWEWSQNTIVTRYKFARGFYACDRVTQPDQLLLGRGLSVVEAPTANLFHRANLCDEVVEGEPRYQVGGLFESTETYLDVENDFAAACAGTIVQPEGAVEIDPGEARAAVVTITDQDLVVGSKVKRRWFLGIADREWVNSVVANYIEPSQKWTQHAAPVRRDNADILADKGPREESLQLGFVSWAKQAGRVAEIIRRLGRLHIRSEIVLPPRFCELEEGDWIVWQSDRYLKGNAYTFRIEAWGSDRSWQHSVVLRQISATCYSDTAPLTDGSVAVLQPPRDPIGAPNPANWSLAAGHLDAGGIRTPALIVVGSADDPSARFVRIEYVQGAGSPTGATVWSDAGVTGPDIKRREIPVAAGGIYRVAVSYIVDGVQGDRLILGPVNALEYTDPDGVTLTNRLETLRAAATFTQDNEPSATESFSGNIWLKTSTGVFYRRVNDGGISLGGFVITLGGNRPVIRWTELSGQPLIEALETAQAAQESAAAALAQINIIGNDDWLSSGEKTQAIVIYKALTENNNALQAKAASRSIAATERTNATASIATLTAFLNSLSPPWDQSGSDSPMDGDLFRAYFADAHGKVAILQAAIQGATGDRAVDIYISQYAPPTQPVGNNPAGWSEAATSDTATKWKSSGRKNEEGNLVGVWSTPVEVTQGAARTYAAGTTFYIRNIALFNGGTYIALQSSSTGNAPTGTDQANSFWGVVAAPGATGAPATPPSAFSATINLTSSSGSNLRTIANANSYTGSSDATITFNVPNGVTITGPTGGGIGIDTGTWPTSSYAIALTLVVQSGGIVEGGGGLGGAGGSGGLGQGMGGQGGDAIYARTPISGGVTINAGGTVRAGGGGGGGSGGSANGFVGGAGGGGGSPNGQGGLGGFGDPGEGAEGTDASGATPGTGAGDGGTYAADGSVSTGPGPDAAGGAAGYAVRKNGHAVTVTNNGTMTGTAA